jgi:tRNA-Thr(GGU) m(6)t(6)A37 methyltransferase TsaA
MSAVSESLNITPIGWLRTGKSLKFDARHQPDESAAETNVLELAPGDKYRKALKHLEGFDRIWLLWWFHRNRTWRPEVLPPRGPSKRRGVFATRSPHRPNPIGITPVRLLAIEKGRLILGPCDLVDGTPVFDIKPYIPSYDSFPDSKAGWIEEVDAQLNSPPAFKVSLSPLAAEQSEWLRREWGVDFLSRMTESLGRDPSPHRTRRIRPRRDGRREIGCGAWYGVFRVDGAEVTVDTLRPSFPLKFLRDPARPVLPDREAQLAFRTRWPDFVD